MPYQYAGTLRAMVTCGLWAPAGRNARGHVDSAQCPICQEVSAHVCRVSEACGHAGEGRNELHDGHEQCRSPASEPV
eukprot:6184839-Pyramimonas_sp.AAC.1